MRRAAVAVVAVLCLLGAVAAGVAVAQETPDSVAAVNDNATYSLSELRQNGDIRPNAPPSTRALGSYGSFWIEWWDTLPWVTYGSDSGFNRLEPGTVIKRNQIEVNSQRGWDASPETYRVHVVTWTEEEVKDGENRAVDQTEHVVQATVGGGYDSFDVPIPPTYNSTKEATMWVEGVDGARWRFQHSSSATTKPADISTYGGLMWYVVKIFVLPTLFGGIAATVLAQKALQRAGAGPQKGVGFYVFLTGFVGAGIVVMFWDGLTSLLTSMPLVFALGISMTVFVTQLETEYSKTIRAWFVRLKTHDVESPTGNTAKDALRGGSWKLKLTELPETGEMAVIRPGIKAFLIRLFGGSTVLEGHDDIETELQMDKGNDDAADQLVFTREDIEYERGAVTWMTPSLLDGDGPFGVNTDILALWMVAAAFSAAVANYVWMQPVLGGIVGAAAAVGVSSIEFEDGVARLTPASIHERRAIATSIVLDDQFEEADTMDALWGLYVERSKRKEDFESFLERKIEETEMQRLADDGDNTGFERPDWGAELRSDADDEADADDGNGGDSGDDVDGDVDRARDEAAVDGDPGEVTQDD